MIFLLVCPFLPFDHFFFHACGLSFFSSRNAHVRREDYSAIGNVVVESSSSNTTKDPIHLFLFPGFTGDSPKHLHSLPMEKNSTLLSTQMCKNPNGYKCCLVRRKENVVIIVSTDTQYTSAVFSAVVLSTLI